MVFLSVGMPRAGSGWFYQIQHDLVVANGGKDARSIRRVFMLHHILTEVNCNIGALTPRRLLLVMLPSMVGYDYVIKAHASPSPLACWFMTKGWLKASYIFRDPRDAMLSSFENGQKALQNNRTNAFSQLTSFEKSLEFMEQYVRFGSAWLERKDVFHVRYEDLLSNYYEQMARLMDFFHIPRNEKTEEVLLRYQPQEAQRSTQAGMHFRKGKIGRFRQHYSLEQQEICLNSFAQFLEKWGYQK